MTKLSVYIGERIREMRKSAGFNREDFSELVGITDRFLADIENYQHDMTVSKLFRICDALNTTPAHILSGSYNTTEHILYLSNRLTSPQKALAIDLLTAVSKY